MLAGRRATTVGDKPGVTKAQQWIKIGNELELLDTPGVLWPKFENDKTGFNLALVGSIKDEVAPLEDLTIYALELINQLAPEALKTRYGLEMTEASSFLKRLADGKCISDANKVYHLILNDYRSGAFGNLTLEETDG